jgi:hypothetical protein
MLAEIYQLCLPDVTQFLAAQRNTRTSKSDRSNIAKMGTSPKERDGPIMTQLPLLVRDNTKHLCCTKGFESEDSRVPETNGRVPL